MDEPTKICSICGEEKPISEFVKCKRCLHGVSSHCKKCHNEQTREKRKADPEKYRQHCRKWRAHHLEQERQRDRDRNEYKKACHRQWREKNLERARKYQRDWYRSNREKTRRYDREFAQRNPEYIRQKQHRRKARKRNLPSTFTIAEWNRALEYFGGCCAVCGRPPGLWHFLAQDHWRPLASGGAYTATNIIPLCHANEGIPPGESCCNNSKRDKDPEVWLEETFGKKKAADILQRIEGYFNWVRLQE